MARSRLFHPILIVHHSSNSHSHMSEMPKNRHNAVPAYRLWYFITSVKCVIDKYTVQENLGSFLAVARLQWLMSKILIYLSVFKRQNHYLSVSEGILLLQESNSFLLNFSTSEQNISGLFFTSRGRLKQGSRKNVQVFTRGAEPFCSVTDWFPLAVLSNFERARNSV